MINVNSLKALGKILEPIGDEHVIKISPAGFEINSFDQTGAMMCRVSMPIGQVNETIEGAEVGMSFEALSKILPVDSPTVAIKYGKGQWEMNAPGYRAKLPTINTTDCFKVPKKGVPDEPKDSFIVDPQVLHDRVKQLKTAIKGQMFTIKTDSAEPGRLKIRDFDAVSGDLEMTITATGGPQGKEEQTYSYDLVIPLFDKLRLSCKNVHVNYMPMPSNDLLKALFVSGVTEDKDFPITFAFIVAPRVKDG